MSARSELDAAAARAGYRTATCALLAQALIPGYALFDELSEEQLRGLCVALELCAKARMRPRALVLALTAQRLVDPEGWRERFWAGVLADASRA